MLLKPPIWHVLRQPPVSAEWQTTVLERKIHFGKYILKHKVDEHSKEWKILISSKKKKREKKRKTKRMLVSSKPQNSYISFKKKKKN